MTARSAAGLELTGVSKSFRQRTGAALPVLVDIDLAVEPGGCLAILGPSGCGKSTLLRLVAGLEHLDAGDSGDIRIGGNPLGSSVEDVGFIFQTYSSFPWLTALENVLAALGRRAGPRSVARARALAHLAAVRLEGHEDVYPDRLSGGQRQRLAFACALAKEPALLLLDEPMGALDALTREHLQIELLRLWVASRRTMVLVTHDISEALLLGSRVVVLSNRPATVLLDVDATLDKAWLRDEAPSVEALSTMARDVRRGSAFLEMADRLRDALTT